ncbi:uncharacterized protein LOC119296796 [Triticum dicoccoides]|uniref:uncharacterized protein LOC119296796 n=1 Tax=Triticum dicoccoides TaxID=85692 RepID=UPI00188FE7C6|nr:uncharacterized protein LOC119296796 [Triticum dicoccoides]
MVDKMPPLAAAASSSRCAPFACRRGAEQRSRGLDHASAPAAQGCGRPLGRAAGVVGGGIAAAFFASLERCACVEVRTTDDLSDCSNSATEAAPLMGNGGSSDRSSTARKKSKRKAGAGKGRRGGHGGFGCCESIN